ncbi:hypothetical protein GB927_020615 [Shinella sp. CPCC 100929]|uniref:Uncharacterized protein n=1 Tax=Shinella lacus TaxID=2654216 RepID=A0ABT1RB94_9HYPH|nr:hypothetical protein [Shinella lacus]MCQ4632461.1 hypothetical protein [Shinella lacus]
MSKRFDEMYISRGEHKEIVAYYQKLVVHMSRKIRAMRASNETEPAVSINEQDAGLSGESGKSDALMDDFQNVVRVDFRQRRSDASVH